MHLRAAPGDIIAGKYAIVGILGEGGMGVVYEATHLKLRQRVAVKMLQPEMLAHDIVVSRFEREARAAAQLRSRHTARVMDVDVTDRGLPYMVMEFLEGHDLETELGQRGRFPYQEAVDYVLQACAAMIEAHRLGIVHRDLKPANLFLALDGETRIIKLLDFGISKVQSESDSSLTAPESVMGTALYMSPEQVRSSGTVDGRTDIWALGIILYELLSGRPPWVGTATQLVAAIVTEDPPDILASFAVPPELVAVIGKALQRDPGRRYEDVKALAKALAPFSSSTGAGRILAEGLLFGDTGSHPRVSLRLRAEESAATSIQPPNSEPRPYAERTAPGWSEHQQPPSKSRTLVRGMIAAFAVGFVVLGASALVWVRYGATKAKPIAVAHSVPQSTSAPSVSVAAAPEREPERRPEPPPSVAIEAVRAPPAGASATTAKRPPVHPTVTPKPPSPPPGPKSQPTGDGIPLLL